MQQTKLSQDRLKNLLVALTVLVVVVVSMGVWRMIQDNQNIQQTPFVSTQADENMQPQKLMQDQSQTLDTIRDQVTTEQQSKTVDSAEQQEKILNEMKSDNTTTKNVPVNSVEEQSRTLDEMRAQYK
jgi:cytoskeletal protein RodZ